VVSKLLSNSLDFFLQKDRRRQYVFVCLDGMNKVLGSGGQGEEFALSVVNCNTKLLVLS